MLILKTLQIKTAFILASVLVSGSASVSAADENACANACTFVLKSAVDNSWLIVNEVRATQRFSPFSTFKIPNSLIALELGVVPDLERKLSFDPAVYPIEDWWPKNWYQEPLNIQQAFKYSAVPIYRTLAAQIGFDNMQRFVTSFNYGNADISSGVDSFWLNGSLQISAKEQVEFLQQLQQHKLPVSETALDSLKNIMLAEETDTYRLYAKTGGGNIAAGRALGWYVGYVENDTGVYFFALNVEGSTFADVSEPRIKLAMQQLRNAGIIP